jgi:hypothetical protein
MDTNQKPNLIHQWGNSILLTWLKKVNCIGIVLSSNKGNKSGITVCNWVFAFVGMKPLTQVVGLHNHVVQCC